MKKRIHLERFCYAPWGTFGFITLPSGLNLASVERPWINNQKMISCIPVGEYDCIPRRFYRGGYDAVQVLGVPNRSHILFHIGNYVHNLNGCIGVNSIHGAKGNEWCAWQSKDAFRRFMDEVGGSKSRLIITNTIGGVIQSE